MTSAERAWKLVQEKKDRKLPSTERLMRFAASLPNGGGSLADIDDALWLTEAIDAAVAERSRATLEAETVARKTTLEGLVGHKVGFCGVDNHTIVLRVQGKLRAFDVREDEQDGYRSSLDEVREVPLADTIHFREPVAVVTVGKVEYHGYFTGYILVDDSGHTWLKAGTDYRDDYYPCFVFDYTPPERPVVAEALPEDPRAVEVIRRMQAEIDALKERIDDMRHDALERGER